MADPVLKWQFKLPVARSDIGAARTAFINKYKRQPNVLAVPKEILKPLQKLYDRTLGYGGLLSGCLVKEGPELAFLFDTAAQTELEHLLKP